MGTVASPEGTYPASPADYGGAYSESKTGTLASYTATKSGALSLGGTMTLGNTGSSSAGTISNFQLALGLNYIICLGENVQSKDMIGCIQLTSQVAAQDALPCDGSSHTSANYKDLAPLIAGVFGQRSATTFVVPDLRGRAIMHKGDQEGQHPGQPGPFQMGQPLGAPSLTLQPANLPAHSHTFQTSDLLSNSIAFEALPPVSSTKGTSTDPTSNIVAQSGSGTKRFATTANAEMEASTLQFSGSAKVTGSIACANTGGTSVIDLYSPWVGVQMGITHSGITPEPHKNNTAKAAYVGEIRAFTGPFVPMGWANCDGSGYDPNNLVLFRLLGTTYSGNKKEYLLPDLTGRIPVGTGQQGQNQKEVKLAEQFGSDTTTLSTGDMPSHTHTLTPSLTLTDTIEASVLEPCKSATADTSTPKNNCFAELTGGDEGYMKPDQKTGSGPGHAIDLSGAQFSLDLNPAIGNTGSATPYNNQMPVMALRYIICIDGLNPIP